MSGRATRGATARAHDERSSLLSLPLRVAALSWGLGTLPLTALLVIFGKAQALCDTLLAVVGLTRQGRAAALALASESTLRGQLRTSSARLKSTQELLARSEASRRLSERELVMQRERAQATHAAHPASAGEAPRVPGAVRQLLYISSAACAASVAALVDAPHLSIERKIVTVSLVPTGLLFLLQRNKTLVSMLFIVSTNLLVTGFVLHLLLLRGFPRIAAMPGARP